MTAHLVYAAGSAIPSATANSVHVMHMAAALGQAGHTVTLVAKRGQPVKDVYAHYGVPPCFAIEYVDFSSRRDLIGYLRLLKRLPRPDLVVGRYLYAILASAERGLPTIYESHDAPGRWRRALEWRLFRRPEFRRLVVISHALAAHYAAIHGSRLRGRCCVLPDAAEDPGPLPAPGQARRLVIGFAGGWYRGRGIELIVRLARQLPTCDFRLAGGSVADLHVRGIEALPNVQCAGYLPHRDVAGFLANCDVLLAPYGVMVRPHGDRGDIARWFSPMKLFEYMALGRAIVCSRLSVLEEVLTDGRNALLCTADAEQDWLAALRRLDADRRLVADLGAQARREFTGRYTWQARAQRFLDGVL